ncbi:MAG: adenylate/guanylate cyclase domain-containing protein [Gammaproteobacteria bacterium]|nr:adenylate/guanylate cyclase domain-containing protein [Gammaproteobacteria bacterium]
MREIQRYIRYALGLALTLMFLLHVGDKYPLTALTVLENLTYDARLKFTVPNKQDNQVIIIDIDEKSLGEIGHWPWNRNVIANMNNQLFDHYKIKEIGYDMVFAEEDIDAGGKLLDQMSQGPLKGDKLFQKEYQKVRSTLQRDELFAESLRNRKTIMGVVFLNDETSVAKGSLPKPVAHLGDSMRGRIDFFTPKAYTSNLKILQDSAFAGGFFDNPALDDDGVFRRVPLLQEHNGQLHESLALALARTAIGSPQIELIVETNPENNNELLLEWVKIGDLHIPVDDRGNALVPYIGKQRSFDYISAADVINKTADINRLKDKIALFGTSAPGLLDLRTTPLETSFPGVEIHANIIQGILDQRIMQKPGYTMGFEFILLVILGLSLTVLLPRLSATWGVVVSFSVVSLIVATNLFAWTQHNTVLPLATPVLLTVVLFTLQMIYGFFIESRGKRHLAHLFGQYVPPDLVNEMSKKMEEINLDGEIKNMTVLFSDVRNFTTISENTEPKELTELINGFLTPITEIIHHQRGTIDKYMGDAVMAFWGAPLDDDQHALHAMNAAMLMTERMHNLRQEFAARGWPEIRVGVGVNTGDMNVGNKGSEFRVDYTVLGDAVNLGSRLEGLTKIYGVDIIVGEATKYAVPEYEYRELDLVKVKGKDEPIAIYEPIGLVENVDKSIRQDLKRFNIGLKHYRSQHWDEAEREIFALSSLDKDRKIYQIYLDRIMQHRKNPPAADWDGSFTFTSK